MEKFRHWFHKYERHISSGSLVVGFIIDNLTLRRVDLIWDNLLIGLYIVIASFGIFAMNAYDEGRFKKIISEKLYLFIPTIVQFVFGGLFSAFFVFYSRSGSFVASWPFILMLGTLLIGNEFVQKHYARLTFQLSVFYVIIFSYLIFLVPIITKDIGVKSFVLSGVISLIILGIFVQILLRLSTNKVKEQRNKIRLYVVSIFAFINLLYFTNSIPPIPLSLSDIGMYHSVKKVGTTYEVTEEKTNFFKRFFNKTVHINKGEELYAWSSVFAPTAINTRIVHVWQYYDEKRGKWIEEGKITFPILGGRDGGYRGYSVKGNVFPGKWRVNVENERGQLIGRMTFVVSDDTSNLKLSALIK